MACAPYAVFRQADPQALPFDGAPFGVALCQFGTMFFPDRANAYREAKRILKSGGTYLLNVWNRIEDNEFVDEVAMAYCQGTLLRAEKLAAARWKTRHQTQRRRSQDGLVTTP